MKLKTMYSPPLHVMHTREGPSFKREPVATSRNVHDTPGITDRDNSYVASSASIDSQSQKRRRQEKDEEKKKRALLLAVKEAPFQGVPCRLQMPLPPSPRSEDE